MSGEIQDKYIDDLESILNKLIEASIPFTSGDTVDETCGTMPLMELLEDTINQSKKLLESNL